MPSEALETGPQALLSRPAWLGFGLVMFALGASALKTVEFTDADAWWIHGTWCAVGLAAVLPILWKTVRRGVSVVLCDHLVMFTWAFTLYFLFGALMLAAGPQDQIDYVLSSYPIDARGAMRANAVNAIGFAIAIAVAALSRGRWLAECADTVGCLASRVPADITIFILLTIGVFGWLNALSADLGLRTDAIVAGVWRNASRLPLVAIFLGAAHSGHRQKLLRFVSVVVALAMAYGGLLSFNKSEVLLPLAALVGGLSLRYSLRVAIPLGVAALATIFVSIGGIASSGRQVLSQEGSRDLGTLQAILEASIANEESYQPWARLCYTSVQVAGMDFYEHGAGGDDFSLVPWLFVPRALVPAKPIITRTGTEFYSKMSGREGSSTGQGIFTGGYYNGGWPGLFGVSALCGWVLAQTSAIARAILARRALLLLPFVLLGVGIGFRIDGHFVADYLGASVFIFYPLVFLSFLISALRGHARKDLDLFT
jgi:hypothetical protein